MEEIIISEFSLNIVDEIVNYKLIKQGSVYNLIINQNEPILVNYNDGIFSLNNHFEDHPNYSIINLKLKDISIGLLQNKNNTIEEENLTRSSRPTYNADQIYVENKPFSIHQLFELIDNGDIELNPNFQRNFIWDNKRQSQLIESILLGLPLPSIYLSQYEDGRLTVVDGLQRLHTIKRFLRSQLKLTGLEYLIEFNDKKYDDFVNIGKPIILRSFRQTTIMCFVLDRRSPWQLKFDLFRRLNSGGRPLNSAEVRNCLSVTKVQDILNECIDNRYVTMTTGTTKEKDLRLEFRDSILRFFYFNEHWRIENEISNYDGDFDFALDGYVEYLNKQTPEYLSNLKNQYLFSMRASFAIFKENAFRKKTSNGQKGPINKALMIPILVTLNKKLNLESVANLENSNLDISNAFQDYIVENREFYNAITSATNSIDKIKKVFQYVNIFLTENEII